MGCLTLEVFSGQLRPTGLTKGCWGQFWSSLLLNVGVSEWIWLGETYSSMWNRVLSSWHPYSTTEFSGLCRAVALTLTTHSQHCCLPALPTWSILLLFVLQFYCLQEIGTQRKIERNLPKFSVEVLKGRRYTFTRGPRRNSWIVAVPRGGRGNNIIQ